MIIEDNRKNEKHMDSIDNFKIMVNLRRKYTSNSIRSSNIV